MPTDPATRLIDHLRRCALAADGDGRGDGELLARFVERRDGAALAALVRRHGPMVWGVCRRALQHQQDAEDAFQATFLVLVRKAASVVPREMVGNWLYGVARQVTLQARRGLARRRAREVQVAVMPDTPASQPDVSADLRSVLDEELVRLPAIYRAVVVLCDLEGRTRKEVAHHLGVPEGTVGGRLARARAMLGKRLARRGVAVSGPTLGTALASQATAAPVPAAVVSSAINVIAPLAAEQAATVAVSPAVAELVSGVTKAMFMTKLKAVAVVALLSAIALGGIGTGIRRLGGSDALAQQKTSPAAEVPMNAQKGGEREKEKEDSTAWGEEVGGLQAGLGFRTGQNPVYRPGDQVQLVVRLRNVGQQQTQYRYPSTYFSVSPPSVRDGKGQWVVLKGAIPSEKPRLVTRELAPGAEVELGDVTIEIVPEAGAGGEKVGTWSLSGTGTFVIQYEKIEVLIGGGDGKSDVLPGSTLGTGKLKIEVREPNAPRLWTLEGELKVHPKFLYRYYLVLLDGQKCALYGADHARAPDHLTRVPLPARVRVRGVLGTAHHDGETKENPSPFPAGWTVFMDVHEVESLR